MLHDFDRRHAGLWGVPSFDLVVVRRVTAYRMRRRVPDLLDADQVVGLGLLVIKRFLDESVISKWQLRWNERVKVQATYKYVKCLSARDPGLRAGDGPPVRVVFPVRCFFRFLSLWEFYGCAHIVGRALSGFKRGVPLYNTGTVLLSCGKSVRAEPAISINRYRCARHGVILIVVFESIRVRRGNWYYS